MYFQEANCSFIYALLQYFAPRDFTKQASLKGNMASQLRNLLHTDQVVKLLNRDPSNFPADMDQTPWTQPAVKMWMSILDLFEGKGKLVVSSIYAMMQHCGKRAPSKEGTC